MSKAEKAKNHWSEIEALIYQYKELETLFELVQWLEYNHDKDQYWSPDIQKRIGDLFFTVEALYDDMETEYFQKKARLYEEFIGSLEEE